MRRPHIAALIAALAFIATPADAANGQPAAPADKGGSTSADAQPGIRILSPADKGISLAGDVGRTSNIRTLRALLDGEKERQVTVDASDLIDRQSAATIDPAQVQILVNGAQQTALLKAQTPTDFRISVTGLPSPGTFTGVLTFRATDPAMALKSTEVPITLIVRYPVTTAVTTLPPSVVLQLSRASRYFQRLSAFPTEIRDKPIDIRGIFPALPIATAEITSLRGDLSSSEFPRNGCSTDNNALNTCLNVENKNNRLFLHVNAREAQPDRYTGNLAVTLTGLDRVIEVPLDFTVRMGPGWVIIWVFAGVLLGRAAKWVNDHGRKIADARRRLTQLKARIAEFGDADAGRFEPAIKDLERLLSTAAFTAFDTKFDDTVKRADLVDRIHQLKAVAQSFPNPGVEAALNGLLSQIAILDTTDLGSRVEAQARLLAPGGAQAEAAARALSAGSAARILAAAERPSLTPLERLQRVWEGKGKQIAALVLIPLLGVLTTVLLAFVGFEAIYINSTKAFGANPVSDFLTALVWGLTTDVAGRTIANVRGGT